MLETKFGIDPKEMLNTKSLNKYWKSFYHGRCRVYTCWKWRWRSRSWSCRSRERNHKVTWNLFEKSSPSVLDHCPWNAFIRQSNGLTAYVNNNLISRICFPCYIDSILNFHSFIVALIPPTLKLSLPFFSISSFKKFPIPLFGIHHHFVDFFISFLL